MHLLADDLLHLHQPLAANKKNIIKNEVPENLYCMQEQTILRIIIHNLLLNANKFTSNGEIVIGATQHKNMMGLTLRDTGIGMDELQIANLNSMKPVTSELGTNNELGWGLGYRFIIDLVKFVKGKINIKSKKGDGTIVAIDIFSREDLELEKM
jgi:signal transduction histidine kinase